MDSDEDNFFDAEDEFDGLGDAGLEPAGPSTSLTGPASSILRHEPAAGGYGAAAPDPASDSMQALRGVEPFPLHRAAWYGQVELVQRLAAGMSKEQLKAHDSQGNTALHVAVMRRQAGVVSALLAAGSSAVSRNARGWVPMMEAVELGDRDLALQLAAAEVAQVRTVVKSKKAALLALLRTELPDFSLQLKWELGSSMPGVGTLVRRYAPHDTYTLWKKGGFIRVDGSLMGIDSESANVVPAWKRGHFSLLYDATGEKARVLIVNHTDKTFLDAKGARKKLGVSGSESTAVETEVDSLMAAEVLQRKKLRSVDFRFKPASGWLTKEVREKVEGWSCKLYEAAGRLVAVSNYKMPYGLTPDMSYDEYLAATFEADPVVESPVNPMNPASFKGRGADAAKAAAKLAVAAKHQRIAAAAAAAKDEGAARVAKAAAVRAAAGGLRALAPRIDTEGEEDDSYGEEEYIVAGDKDQCSYGKERSSGPAKRSGGSKAARKTVVPAVSKDRQCGGADMAHVVASAELPPSPLQTSTKSAMVTADLTSAEAAAATGVADDGDKEEVEARDSGGDDVAEMDLTALAARVAAEAAVAQRTKRDDEDEDDEGTEDGRDGGNGDNDRTSLGTGYMGKFDASSEGDPRPSGGKRGSAAVAGPSPSSTSSAGAVAAATATKSCKKIEAKGNCSESAASSGGGQKRSKKVWQGWGFSRKDSQSSAGNGEGAGGGRRGSTAGTAATGAAAKKSRKFTGRCWMAESFPLSLKQLLPLLEVVGTANKAFSKVARFMQKYGDLEMFPVKVQVPLILTIYMLLSFKQFRLLGEGPGCMAAPHDDFFQVPPGYTEDTLEKGQCGATKDDSLVEEGGTTSKDSAANEPAAEKAAAAVVPCRSGDAADDEDGSGSSVSSTKAVRKGHRTGSSRDSSGDLEGLFL